QAELMATRHYVPRAWPFAFTNGIQASWLEVDLESGFVKLIKHWCVEDCGTVINPQLVDEQIRGGIVQGSGRALFEHCLYVARGPRRGQASHGRLPGAGGRRGAGPVGGPRGAPPPPIPRGERGARARPPPPARRARS